MMGAPEIGGGIRAAVIVPFRGVVDGEIYPRNFVPGDIVAGSLAVSAIGSGKAQAINQSTLENKADTSKKATGPTGQDGSSSLPPAGQAKGKRTSRRRAAKPSS